MTARGGVATGVGKMMKAMAPTAAALLLICAGNMARAGDLDDFAAPYLQRKDSITAGAGNSKAVNSVTHMIDPWPPYAGNRRIPGNGERMVGAVERYRDVRKLDEAPAALGPAAGGQAGSAAGTSTATSSTSTSTGR